MNWLHWLGVAAGFGLAGYIAWGMVCLGSMRWPDLAEDADE